MAAAAKRIEIGARDRAALEAIVGAGTSQARMVARARIVLEAGEGRSAAQIGRRGRLFGEHRPEVARAL